jgi:hypothetical protein
MKASELDFGLKLPLESPLWWGARAIFTRGSSYRPDLLRDRQSWVGGTNEERRQLSEAINTVLPDLRRRCAARGEELSAAAWEHVETFSFDRVTFHVSCRRSFGYLYISATWSAALERQAAQ